MRAEFEGPAAEVMAAARARVAAQIEAAGGREAWHAQNAHQQLVADAKRRAEAAQAAVEAARRALAKAELAARVAGLVAEGQWVVVGGGVADGYDSPQAAKGGAEWLRASGQGAHVNRPYCGHGWDDRLTKADSPCRGCAKAGRK